MLSPLQVSSLILITVSGLLISFALHASLVLGFILGFLYLLFLVHKQGATKKIMVDGMLSGARRTKEVVWILLLVGLLIPAWTASGTIPYLIHLGLSWVHPAYYLTYCFLATMIISMVLGSSTGSLSTIGLPLMGIGAILQIPLPEIAGALVSGAFVGDRTSPLSSANQLVAACTETRKEEYGKALRLTTIGGITFSICFFLLLDWTRHNGTIQSLDSQYSFAPWFHFHTVLLLPPALLLAGIICRIKTKYAFLIGIGSSLIIGFFLQHLTISKFVHFLLFGYDQSTLSFLHSKGLLQMVDLILFILLTGAFNGVLEETQMIQPYFQKVMGSSLSMGMTTCRIGIFGLAMACLSCNQTLPIMISGRNFRPVWAKQFPSSHLARVVADTSLVFAGLVPWNMLAILCSTILGVSVIQYVPFAMFLMILPLLTVVVSIYFDHSNIKKEQKRSCGVVGQ